MVGETGVAGDLTGGVVVGGLIGVVGSVGGLTSGGEGLYDGDGGTEILDSSFEAAKTIFVKT